MTRCEDHVEREPGQLKRLAAGDCLVGVVALERAEAGPRYVVHDVREHACLELRAVDRRTCRLRHRRDRADVVEVRVREEDRVELGDAEGVDRRQQLVGLLAGVDDHGVLRALLAHYEAVLLHRPDGEHAHVDHRPVSFLRWRRR